MSAIQEAEKGERVSVIQIRTGFLLEGTGVSRPLEGKSLEKILKRRKKG